MKDKLTAIINRKELIGGGIVVLLLGAMLLFRNYQSTELVFTEHFEESLESLEMTHSAEESLEESAEAVLIYIDIKGAVAHPGVYQLDQGSRMMDAIAAAGGLLPEADERHINQAALVEDQMFIYIYSEEEANHLEIPTPTVEGWEGEVEQSQININSGSLEDLQQLPGIGPAKAQAIITHREEHGSFASLEALMEVSGIGEKTFESLKDLITH